MNIGDDVVHHRLHDAQRPSGQYGALVVKAAHEHLGTLVHTTQHIGRRDFHVVEHQLARVAAAHAELVELLRNAEAWHALFNEECRHAPRAQFRLRLGVDHQSVSIRAVGDPHLAAVEQVVATLVFGLQLHADHVGAGTRLTHRQSAHMFTADELGQVLLLLGFVAVAVDLVHAEITVSTVGQPHRSAGPRDFLHSHHVGQIAHRCAAVLLGYGNAQHAQVTHAAPEIHGELVGPINFCCTRRNF